MILDGSTCDSRLEAWESQRDIVRCLKDITGGLEDTEVSIQRQEYGWVLAGFVCCFFLPKREKAPTNSSVLYLQVYTVDKELIMRR